MRIMYTNPYRDHRTFLLRTDRPDLLRFEVRTLLHCTTPHPAAARARYTLACAHMAAAASCVLNTSYSFA